MLEIKPLPIQDSTVTVPGSKSYSHRLLIATALSDGECHIDNLLRSEDTLLTLKALQQMGIRIEDDGNRVTVFGEKGFQRPCPEPIYLANSGTSMRLLCGVAAIGKGAYRFTGTDRMHQRPIQDLLDGLVQLKVPARSVEGNGCPPVEIQGGSLAGGAVRLKCDISSQYLSALMLIAPYTKEGLDIIVTHGPVSKPYVDMTVDIMTRLGVSLEREDYQHFRIPGHQSYRSGDYRVESDASQAGYFWAAAAVTGKTIKVKGVTFGSRQGDVNLARVFEQMGCRVTEDPDGIAVTGGRLKGVTVDMSDMPDMVPTLAVVAAFAEGVTRIENVAHLKAKESDRIGSVVTELNKMGGRAEAYESGMVITGGNVHGTDIETYNDHRMAMSFAVAGLRTPDIRILNEMCVEKSFPNFWEVFGGLYPS